MGLRAGFRDWGLGFGVWVWGLGFRVEERPDACFRRLQSKEQQAYTGGFQVSSLRLWVTLDPKPKP